MTLRARSARKSADGASAHKSPSERSGHILLEPRGSGMFEDIKAHDLTAPMCMVLVNIAGHVTHVQVRAVQSRNATQTPAAARAARSDAPACCRAAASTSQTGSASRSATCASSTRGRQCHSPSAS